MSIKCQDPYSCIGNYCTANKIFGYYIFSDATLISKETNTTAILAIMTDGKEKEKYLDATTWCICGTPNRDEVIAAYQLNQRINNLKIGFPDIYRSLQNILSKANITMTDAELLN